MTNQEKILQLAKKNDGIVTNKEITQEKIPRIELSNLVASGHLMPVQRGVYVTEEGFADDFFLLQYQFPKGIFSHETALYLLGFSDRVPIEIVMTFPFGTNTRRIKQANVRPIMISQYYDLGMIEMKRSGGQLVKVYNMERTLVDLVKPRYQADKEQLVPAFKQYARWDKKNIPQLFRYAKLFGVEEKLRSYMEVLL
ncbi:type IV toxin-antitoxin system AbiEi family antitoxin domain-containing protein [Listeria innocua]|uniref:type IV toxin-antitoxin system AbiEi family antitoxin domain-containing protein n=1 Tax=Listeria innocua TaxID=1642 RepID=UPI00162715B3|nr:type IV toxin-antitoxin system AbiEi family antitoxin domain-containing protein [Listeria innocua]MBC1925573.1 hypothetical protein [Listeria innocua]